MQDGQSGHHGQIAAKHAAMDIKLEHENAKTTKNQKDTLIFAVATEMKRSIVKCVRIHTYTHIYTYLYIFLVCKVK